jgi:short-subunit dehydrogenase
MLDACLSHAGMCAFPRPTSLPAVTPIRAVAQPEAEMDSSRPAFLSRRSKNAKGTLIGGAALAGAAALGTAALAMALYRGIRRGRTEALRGKVVVITGSSRGLGLAIAEEFGHQGARVVLTARDHHELERARVILLEQQAVNDPQDILVVLADLRKPEEAEYLIHRVTEAWGQVDVLVNNAGIITVGPFENMSPQDFHDVMETNFFSGVHCALSVAPQMLKRGDGTIVNITSIGGKVAVPHMLPYTASKFAAVGFSEGLHVELRSKGINVLTVVPGLMRTGSHLNAFFSGDAEREYRWFSRGASLPGASTSARRAARRIVNAVLAGETEIAITPQAALASRLSNVSPELTAHAMGIMNRILPSPTDDLFQPVRGKEVRGKEPGSASRIGWAAARRYNEIDGTANAG